jgi:hypothetical protein
MEGNSRRGQGLRWTVALVVEDEEEEDLSTFLDGLNKTTINLNQDSRCSGRASIQATPE